MTLSEKLRVSAVADETADHVLIDRKTRDEAADEIDRLTAERDEVVRALEQLHDACMSVCEAQERWVIDPHALYAARKAYRESGE